jgi:hypothetical protein
LFANGLTCNKEEKKLMENERSEHILQVASKYQVAFDLMCAIAEEDGKQFGKPDPRTYYFTLYQQCLKVVSGVPVEDALRSL